MKKRFLSLLLALALLCGLTTTALAAKVVLSPQSLTVDGEPIVCEKYNIDGSNYFKLRDLALLLNGTDCQFSVGWDAATDCVTINSGEPYEPNGSELVIGADRSSTAKPTAQTIYINGELRSDLSVYNLADNNFFKLRDLGEALGFTVDYDAATNTAIVLSIPPRAVADQLDFRLTAGEEEFIVSDLIFNGDVTVSGDSASITFTNCQFNGNVINSGKVGTAVSLWNCEFAADSRCVFNSGAKEAGLDYDMPKFMTNTPIDVVAENSLGSVVTVEAFAITVNGVTYTMTDAEYFLSDTGMEPYTGQTANSLYVGQWWEKGGQVLFKLAQLVPEE